MNFWATRAGVQSILIILFIFTYVFKILLGATFLTGPMAMLSILISAISITTINRSSQKQIGLLVGIGLVCLLFTKEPVNWAAAITANSGIVTLLLTAPLLGLILNYSPYERVMLCLADRWIKSTYAFYAVTFSLLVLFSGLMNLGSLPFVKQLIASVKDRYPNVVLDRAITRGFTINFFWMPNLISLAVILQCTGVSWNEIVLPGMMLSILSYFYAFLFGSWEIYRANGEVKKNQIEDVTSAVKVDGDITMAMCRRYMGLLGGQIIVILAFLTFFTSYVKYNVYISVALVSMIVPLLFAVVLGKVNVWWECFSSYGKKSLHEMVRQIVFFTSIGFFGYSLSRSPIIDFVRDHIGLLSYLGIELIFPVIIALIGGLAIIGIHPIITISSLAIFLVDLDLGFNHLQLAAVLTLGYLVYVLLSPFSSMVLIWSSLTKKSSYDMSIKVNWQYSISYSLIMSLIIVLWVRLT